MTFWCHWAEGDVSGWGLGDSATEIYRNAGDRSHQEVRLRRKVHIPGIVELHHLIMLQYWVFSFDQSTVPHMLSLKPPAHFLILHQLSCLQEFVNQFRVLLPKDTKSFKEDISELLEKKMGLEPATYQIGKTKVTSSCMFFSLPYVSACEWCCYVSSQVFLKELERQKLQESLHKDVMHKIIFLQRWFRARLQRKEFLDMRQAAILLQVTTEAEIIYFNFLHFITVKCQEQIQLQNKNDIYTDSFFL